MTAESVKKAEKTAGMKGAKPKAEKKLGYKIVRSPEAVKMSREKIRLEKKKGKFKKPGYGKMDKVKNRWRKPKGIDSRQREHSKDKPPMPNAGYMTPQSVKGMSPTGYFPVRVFNVSDLTSINAKTQAVIIASVVGKKKRVEIQKAAQEKKIQVLNYRE